MGKKLFDEDDSNNDDLSRIEIDKEYARRYEHNKKREDLQRYEELKKMGLISHQSTKEETERDDSDSEESDDDDNNNEVLAHSREKDLEFFNALLMVKKQHPILENKELELFEHRVEDEAEDDDLEKKKKMYLKDVVARHLIEEGPEFTNKDGDDIGNKKKLSYNEEQEEIRMAFLDAVEANGGEDDGGDLFQVKEKERVGEDESDDGEFKKKLDDYFGDESGDLELNFLFLIIDYFC